MLPIDIRDANWHNLRHQLGGRLAAVYYAWCMHSPATTRELAEITGIDILNIRPRTTDLVKVGLVEMIDTRDGQGIYRARTQVEWENWAAPQRIGTDGQLHLI